MDRSKQIMLLLALVILAGIAFLAPWAQIARLFSHLTPRFLLACLGLSIIYYSGKTLRFWVMLRQLGIKVDLSKAALAYMAAQPITILPAGELYRTVLLKRYTGVRKRDSAATITLQGLIEAVVLLLFALIGAFAMNLERLPVISVALVLLGVLLALQRGWLAHSWVVVKRLPFVSVSRRKYIKLLEDHRRILAPASLMPLLILSFVPVIAGICLVLLASRAIGAPLSPAQASVAYCLPVILSGLSFLPGGLGATEGGTIGLLHLMKVATAPAVAITLIVRIFTLGAGMLFGLLALTIGYFHAERA